MLRPRIASVCDADSLGATELWVVVDPIRDSTVSAGSLFNGTDFDHVAISFVFAPAFPGSDRVFFVRGAISLQIGVISTSKSTQRPVRTHTIHPLQPHPFLLMFPYPQHWILRLHAEFTFRALNVYNIPSPTELPVRGISTASCPFSSWTWFLSISTASCFFFFLVGLLIPGVSWMS